MRRPVVAPVLRLLAATATAMSMFAGTPAAAQAQDQTQGTPATQGSGGHSAHGASQPASAEQPATMSSMDMGNSPSGPPAPADTQSKQGSSTAQPMDMGSMQGGRAPVDARDPNAFADGYENSTLPGFEKTDQLPVSFLLVDQLEFVSSNEGDGIGWSAQFARGGDIDKLWLRTQGIKTSGGLDPQSGMEALWWHAYSPFWGRTLGVRQDIGRGARTWLAFGIEGLAPYWFDVELTGYVSDAGHLSARLKASYDLLLTNRLIMTPSIESNVFSKKQADRQLGSGVSNLELGVRLRYEIRRKFAPYVGLAWERSIGETADFKRLEGDPVTERRLVAGVRLWW